MVASTVTKAAVKVTGAKSGDLAAQVAGVALDPAGRAITIQFSALPNADRIKIELLPAIRDPWGQPIQAIVLPFSVKPQIALGLLAGDVDGSGKVNEADVQAVRAHLGQRAAGPEPLATQGKPTEPASRPAPSVAGQVLNVLNARYDVHGSGDITEADAQAVQKNIGQALP